MYLWYFSLTNLLQDLVRMVSGLQQYLPLFLLSSSHCSEWEKINRILIKNPSIFGGFSVSWYFPLFVIQTLFMPLCASRESGMTDYGCFRFLLIKNVIMVFVQIIVIEWSTVAILYDPSENNVRICLITFMLYKSGLSVSGFTHVFLNVGMNATRSIPTTTITEIVGSLVRTHGISPRSAIMRK